MEEVFGKKYLTAFYVTVVLTSCCFSIFLFHYLLQNHGMRFPIIGFRDQWHAGRWFSSAVFGFYSFKNVPFLLPFSAIALNVASILIMLKLWDRNTFASTGNLVLIALVATTHPVALSSFYYHWQVLVFSSASFLSVLAINFVTSFSWWRITFAATLFMLALATYQASLSVMATLLMCTLLLELSNSLQEKSLSIRRLIMSALPGTIVLVVGLILYRVSLVLLDIEIAAHAKPILFADVLNRFREVTWAALESLVITQPDIPILAKYLLLASGVIAASTLLGMAYYSSSNTIERCAAILTSIVLILGFIIASKAMFLVAANSSFHQYRYNFSVPFFFAFCFYFSLRYSPLKPIFYATLVVSFVVIFQFAQANLMRQGVLLRAQQHDLAISNRILTRIESMPEIDYTKKYYLVRTGPYSNFKKTALKKLGEFDTVGDGHLDNGEFSALWTPASAMELLGSKIQWIGVGYMSDFSKMIKESKELAKEQGREPWPHSSSVFIHGDRIIVYM